MDDVLTTAEAARYLKIGKKTLCAMVRAGRIPVMRLGNKGKLWRFVRKDLVRPPTTATTMTVTVPKLDIPPPPTGGKPLLRRVKGGLRYR